MPESPATATRVSWRRHFHWRRLLAVKLLLIVAVLGSAYWYIANPGRAARLAAGLLEGLTGSEVAIDKARFSLNGMIELDDVALNLHGMPGDGGRLFAAERIHIEHNVWALLIGRFSPSLIRVESPVIFVTDDVQTGLFNFQHLPSEEKPDKAPLPKVLPRVELEGGKIVFGEVDGDAYTQREAALFEGRLEADPAVTTQYRFTLEQQTLTGEPELTLAGSYDPQDKTFTARVDTFTLKDAHRNLMPLAWRNWWDAHEPAGTMEYLRFGYDLAKDHFYVEISVENVSLIPPHAPFTQARLPMTGGTGRFTFTNNELTIKKLRGTIEDIDYQIDGHIYGYKADSALSLRIRAEPFVIPQDPRYLLVLPEPVVRFFRQYEPSGRFSALVELDRAAAGAELRYQGTVQLHDVTAAFTRFPYPLRNLRGTVRFDEEQVVIESVSGQGPTEAAFRIDGRIWPPRSQPAVDIHVTALDVPLDETLAVALEGRRARQGYEIFQAAAEHAALAEAGLLQTSEQRRALEAKIEQLIADRAAAPEESRAAMDESLAQLRGQAALPVFDLGGKINFTTRITREQGEGTGSQVVTTVDIAGINALCERWPYPLRVQKGTLVVGMGQIDVKGVVARGLAHADSYVAADGVILLDDRKPLPDIKVVAQHLPLDELLLASVSPAQRRWLEDLRITGVLAAFGQVMADEEGRIDFRLASQLSDGAAQPFAGDYAIADLGGTAIVARDYLEIEQLQGVHGESQLTLAGRVDWASDRRGATLRFTGADMRFQDAVLDLMPPDLATVEATRRFVADHRPQGVYDATLDLTIGAETDYVLALKPRELALDLRGQRVSLRAMEGTLHADNRLMRLEDLRGAFDDGRLAFSGQVLLGETIDARIALSAVGDRVGQSSRALLPAAVRRTIDNLSLDGGYQVSDAKFHYLETPGAPAAMTFDGVVRLESASANVGLAVRELTGRLDIHAGYDGAQPWPTIDIDFTADSVRIEDRFVSPLTMHLSNAGDPQLLLVEDIQGECYGGLISGSARVALGADRYFRVDTVLQDADLQSFVSPPLPDDTARRPKEDSGIIAAQLSLEGRIGDPDSHHGRGEIVVADARMYETPLSLALLQMINLTFPSANSFDAAAIRFLVDGDNVLLEQLVFDAPSVRLAGRGVMAYSTRQLDLDLVSSNPSAWNLGPVGDLIGKFKDELISIRVTGTLDKPQARVASFRGTSASWQTVFTPGRPRREQLRDDAGTRQGQDATVGVDPASADPGRLGQ